MNFCSMYAFSELINAALMKELFDFELEEILIEESEKEKEEENKEGLSRSTSK